MLRRPRAVPPGGLSWRVELDWSGATAAAERLSAAWRDGPGGAFALFDTDGVRNTACGGLASLEHGLAFTADTPSRYASISKHMLATCLLGQGVALDSALGMLLPGLPDPIGAVPLARALDMTGGLPDMMELQWQLGVPFTASWTAEEVAVVLHRVAAACAPPGTEMAYSNTGWRLGQAVLERQSGLSYRRLLQDRLFGPLGLGMVFPYDEAEPVPGLATGYWLAGDGWRRGRYGMHMSASGGMAGSAAELGRWAGALMAGRGPLRGILPRLAAPRFFADGRPSAYRLGLVETALGGTRVLAHSGSLPGYRNHLLMAPERGVGVALLLNRDEDPLLPALQVMAALLGEDQPEPAPDIPPGLYAEAEGPAWAELHPSAIEFMGAREGLLRAGSRVRSIPSTLEMDLAITEDGIEGMVGGVTRRLDRVQDGLRLDPALVGTWREEVFGVTLSIAADGTARWPWMGLGQDTPLQPLPGARALGDLRHLMWRHRPCLCLDGEGVLRVAGHRARVLRFRRA